MHSISSEKSMKSHILHNELSPKPSSKNYNPQPLKVGWKMNLKLKHRNSPVTWRNKCLTNCDFLPISVAAATDSHLDNPYITIPAITETRLRCHVKTSPNNYRKTRKTSQQTKDSGFSSTTSTTPPAPQLLNQPPKAHGD